jgi:hypothetical protein
MPQCGRLRSIRVCGFQPTDPPPYRPRPEGRFVRFIRSAARLIKTFGTGFLPLGFGLAAGQIGFKKERLRWRLRIQFPDRSRGRATSPTLRGERSRRAGGKNWARRRDRIDAVPGRTNESGSRPNARASVMGNVSLWSMFQALRRGPVQYTDCFSWRERGKLCGVARPNEEEMRRDRPRARPFRGQ